MKHFRIRLAIWLRVLIVHLREKKLIKPPFLKKSIILFLTILLLDYPEYKKNVNYYHEFWLMYLQNELIIAKMKDYVNEIKTIQSKIFHFEVYYLY